MSPAVSGRSLTVIGAWVAYLVFVSFVALGFLLHTSAEPHLGGYSYRTLALVVAVAAVLLVPPAVLQLFVARLGRRSTVLALIPVLVLGLVAWILLGTRYYWKQTHLFDPFLQISGYPVPEVEHTGEIRVLTLGGSTTEGGKLEVEDRYPSRLSEELRGRLGRPVEVHNAGRVWWTSKHSLINYVTDGRRWNADVVVVMHAINDLYRSCSPAALAIGEYNPRWSHFYGAAIKGARPPTFAGSFLAPVLSGMNRDWYRNRRFNEIDFPVEHYQSLPDFERHLRALVGYIRSDGAQPVLMTQPTLLRPGLKEEERDVLDFGRVFCSRQISAWNIEMPSPESLARAMAAYNEVTRKVAREEAVPLVDLSAVVPRTLDYFVDDVHHTPLATALISNQVANVLLPLFASRDSPLPVRDASSPKPGS